jgi:hypothetical protein
MALNPNIKKAHSTSEYTPENLIDLQRCMEDPIYFMTKFVKVQHPTKGLLPFELYDYQVDMVRAVHEHKDVVILASRQLGKTTVVAMYMLWFSMFQEDKICVIASKNLKHSVMIMSRIKQAYESLPDWLKAGCKFFNRTMIEFDNRSKIVCEATTENTGRGDSPSILMIDEIAFLKKRIQDDMWASIAPSLSTGGKFILTSTPNGDADLFATVWRGALSGTNSFYPVQVLWHQHPDRKPESGYYEEMVGKLGPVKAKQELDCEFLSSDALLINSMKLQQLTYEAPLYEDMGFKFWVPQEQLGGQGRQYLVSLDPATGSGSDFSVIEVFEFPSLAQVAEFRSNELNIPLLYAKLKWVLNLLSRPVGRGRAEVLWTFERNGIGEAVSALYFNDEAQPEYAELFSDHHTKLGVFTSGRAKIQACLSLKSLIERVQGGFRIRSKILLDELKNFVAKGGSYEGKPGMTDDAVMALVIATRLLKRLGESDERAFAMTHEYVDPDASVDETDAPMPFAVG